MKLNKIELPKNYYQLMQKNKKITNRIISNGFKMQT